VKAERRVFLKADISLIKPAVAPIVTLNAVVGALEKAGQIATTGRRPIIAMPVSSSERDPQWQENVLRNAALTTSRHTLSAAGLHTLKIWMVDPGIVLDAVLVDDDADDVSGYLWPVEARHGR
jgi:hypothetical protein